VFLVIAAGLIFALRTQLGLRKPAPSPLVLRDIVRPDGSQRPESGKSEQATNSRGRAQKGGVTFSQLSASQQMLVLNSQVAQGQKSAISTFHAIIAAAPAGNWPTSIISPQQCDQVLSLARQAILDKPQDPAGVSDAQRGIVEALACEGNRQAALVEAKKFFNVASLKSTANAIALISELLPDSGGAATSFESQQRIGATTPLTDSDSWTAYQAAHNHTPPSVLRSITIDRSQYSVAIEKTTGKGSYDDVMACGNLLLLSDSPEAAQECFLKAGRIAGSKGGKKLFAAVEGVLKSIRDQTETIGIANAVEFALKSGKPQSSLFPADSFDPSSLQLAGARLDRAVLPENFFPKGISTFGKAAVAMVATPQPDAKIIGADRALIDPVELAASAPFPDAALVAWLENWKKDSAAGGTVSSVERDRLRSILEKTTETSIQLFPIAHAIHLRVVHDLVTPSIVYQAASLAAEQELLRLGKDEAALGVLHLMDDHIQDYKDVLWPLIDTSPRDYASLRALDRIYSNIVAWPGPEDEELAKSLTHVKIGLAECRCLEGNPSNAISLLYTIDIKAATQGESTAYAWALAMSQYRAGRFVDAIPELERVVAQQDQKNRQSAQHLLIFARAKAGDTKGANLAFDEWVRDYRPTPKEAAPALEFIERAPEADHDLSASPQQQGSSLAQ
jgi:hypothetical protein